MSDSPRLYAADEWRSIRWPAGCEYEQQYLQPLLARGVTPFVSNVETSFFLLYAGGEVFPVTVNRQEYANSYVCSPYVSAVSYPLEELVKINSKATRGALRTLILSVAPLLRWANIDRVVSVNNWLLSTNLYSCWDGSNIREVTAFLTNRFPGHAILFRSLNRITNPTLCDRFIEAGYLLAPSRQVYLINGAQSEYLRRPNTRWDQRLLQATDYKVVDHDGLRAADDDRIRDLYNFLYLQKYSQHNPHFSSELVGLWREKRLLTMFGLRSAAGKLDGVVGCFSRGGVLTAPLVGYDTNLPQRSGLYRMLMAIVLRKAAEDGMMLNLSSGAAQFKRLRGGKACMEYTAVAYRHLPFRSRQTWRALAALMKSCGERTLRTYQL